MQSYIQNTRKHTNVEIRKKQFAKKEIALKTPENLQSTVNRTVATSEDTKVVSLGIFLVILMVH